MALSEDNKAAFRIAHLNMIQGAISRMSGFSASAKTFTVTILAGLAAIAFQVDKTELGIIAIFATSALCLLDVYYLTLELRFRAFYDDVAARSLNSAENLSINPLKKDGDVNRAFCSNSTKLFYGPVFVACLFFIGYESIHDWWTAPDRLSGTTSPRVEQPVGANPNSPAEQLGKLAQPAASQSTGAPGNFLRQPETSDTRRAIRSEASPPGSPHK